MTDRHPLDAHIDSKLLGISRSVNRMDRCSKDTFSELLAGGIPAIVTNVIDDWPATKSWTPEYIKKRWGQRPIRFMATNFKDAVPYSMRAADVAHQTKLIGDIMDGIIQDPANPVYINQKDAEESFPGSSEDLRYSNLLGSAASVSPNVWIGTPGTKSGLHWDPQDNLIATYYGAKIVVLVSPNSPKSLCPFRENPTKSRINAQKVDWNLPRAFQNVDVFVDVIQKGEVLFLPKMWWHYFTTVETCINTSCWFNEPCSKRQIFGYMNSCGLKYWAAMFGQTLWYGILRRPFEIKALGQPPLGLMLYDHVVLSFKERILSRQYTER